jgi:hypothetical protein
MAEALMQAAAYTPSSSSSSSSSSSAPSSDGRKRQLCHQQKLVDATGYYWFSVQDHSTSQPPGRAGSPKGKVKSGTTGLTPFFYKS